MEALQVKQICMYLELADLPKIINTKYSKILLLCMTYMTYVSYIYMTCVILMYDMFCMTFVMDRNCKRNGEFIFFSGNLRFIKRSCVFKITLAIYLLNPPLVHNNCILHNTHCVKWPLPPRILLYCSDLLAFKYVNLIL